jgi:beta-phosphoglucomutase
MANPIQAVIWDLDGVIIDSAEQHREAWQRLAREEGVPLSDAQFWSTFGQRNDAILTQIWGSLSKERIQELGGRKEVYYREYVRETARALPGAIELLSELYAAGYPMALASSAPIANVELVSEVLGLRRFLKALVSGDTVPHGKPAPDVFLKAASELGIEPAHCLVFEDAVAGVQAAKAGGMYCIAVAGPNDQPGLHAANLVVQSLTQVHLAQIQQLAAVS